MWNSSECRIPTSVCCTMNNCLDWIASRKHLTRTHVASAGDGGCACRIQRVRFVDVFFSHVLLYLQEALDRCLCPTFQRSDECPGLFLRRHGCMLCLAWCARSNYHEEVDFFFDVAVCYVATCCKTYGAHRSPREVVAFTMFPKLCALFGTLCWPPWSSVARWILCAVHRHLNMSSPRCVPLQGQSICLSTMEPCSVEGPLPNLWMCGSGLIDFCTRLFCVKQTGTCWATNDTLYCGDNACAR